MVGITNHFKKLKRKWVQRRYGGGTTTYDGLLILVLRIRIRNLVISLPLYPGSGMKKNQRSGIRDSRCYINIPDHISESLVSMFWAKNT